MQQQGACTDDLSTMMHGSTNMRAVMQLLSRYLPEYRMSLLTTKCLNTAVMVMYLALGDGALTTTRQCDVETVRRRRRDSFQSRGRTIEDRAVAARLMRRVLLPPSVPSPHPQAARELHYVMLTDGHMPRAPHASAALGAGGGASAAPEKTRYFPGHVFVIESFPGGGGDRRFRLYQSYINQYDVVQHTAMMHSSNGGDVAVPDIGRGEIVRLMDGLVDMASRRLWTPETTAFWSWFARVPREHAAQFEGYVREGVILMCHRHVRADQCARTLRTLANRALKDTAPASATADAQVWGDASLYDATNGAKPLTVREMRQVLTSWMAAT
jgi:hypothetical protein